MSMEIGDERPTSESVARDGRAARRASCNSEHEVQDQNAQELAETPLDRLATALRQRVATAPGEERAASADGLRRHVEQYLAASRREPGRAAPRRDPRLDRERQVEPPQRAGRFAGSARPGVLRPTTRQPIAIANPADLRGVIGAIARKTGCEVRMPTTRHAAGWCIVDAPDFDSVEAANRERALGLLEMADLVIFVTTATRYADQVPWEVLARARARGVPLLAVLNRLPPETDRRRCRDRGLPHLLERGTQWRTAGTLEVVAVPEGAIDAQHDALAAEAIAPVREALDRLVDSSEERRALARRGLAGALRGVPGRRGNRGPDRRGAARGGRAPDRRAALVRAVAARPHRGAARAAPSCARRCCASGRTSSAPARSRASWPRASARIAATLRSLVRAGPGGTGRRGAARPRSPISWRSRSSTPMRPRSARRSAWSEDRLRRRGPRRRPGAVARICRARHAACTRSRRRGP